MYGISISADKDLSLASMEIILAASISICLSVCLSPFQGLEYPNMTYKRIVPILKRIEIISLNQKRHKSKNKILEANDGTLSRFVLLVFFSFLKCIVSFVERNILFKLIEIQAIIEQIKFRASMNCS